MKSECVVCGGAESRSRYSGILECCRCGHVFADLRLTDQEFHDLYQRSYFFGEEYGDYIADKEIIQRNFRKRFRVLRGFLGNLGEKSLFEVGSAYGFFLDIVRDDFKSVSGIDVAEEGVCFSRDELKLDVIRGDLLNCDLGERKYDVVCMWDTIEHLAKPQRYLEKIGRHTERGALLALTTGDIQSLNARLRKGKWRLIHPPTHVHYFCKETLTRMLGNYGFNILYSEHCGFHRSLDSMANAVLTLHHDRSWLYEVLKTTGILRLNAYLNLYDILYVIAKKE